MQKKDIVYYCKAISNLRRDSKNGGAPHKPIMLLSLIDAVENGFVQGNQVYVIPELIGYFKANWSILVETRHDPRFALPFFHLSSEPFWKLIPNDGCELWVQSKAAMRNLNNLQTAVRYAAIDIEFLLLLKNQENRDLFRQILLEKYFPKVRAILPGNMGLKIVRDIETQLAEDSPTEYVNRIQKLKSQILLGDFEEEIALRSAIFKRKIPQLYGYSCCISNYKVDVSFNATTLIEACHIKPFRISFDDTITNGLALCPTLHTAFDAGLFTISESFSVIVSDKIQESNSTQNLRQFHGSQIMLPDNAEKYKPNLDSLKWHRENVFERGR
ncbi:MAG: HNH endonuclease [Saprospiraceae bacterium]